MKRTPKNGNQTKNKVIIIIVTENLKNEFLLCFGIFLVYILRVCKVFLNFVRNYIRLLNLVYHSVGM